MLEIGASGSMSGERKRSVAEWPKPPRLSSTLLFSTGAKPLSPVRNVRYGPDSDRLFRRRKMTLWAHPDIDYCFSANCFATSRACSIKSCATGLSIRFLRLNTPIGTGGSGSATGNTLNGSRAAGNFNRVVEKIER